MQYCRFLSQGKTLYGNVELRAGQAWITALVDAPEEDLAYRIEHGSFLKAPIDFAAIRLCDAQLLVPVTPSKIICIGRNYRDHVKELEHELPTEPLIFLKPPSALLAPGGTIVRPPISQRVDYEGELAMVIGRRGHHIAEADWASYVRGYTVANDVTARDIQESDGQWPRAKGFDTFCPIGPVVSTEIDPANAKLETRVNGQLRQQGTTADLIFGLPRLIAHISAAFTLEPGDLILTGTPAGIGPLFAGDQVEVTIAGIGTLANSVR